VDYIQVLLEIEQHCGRKGGLSNCLWNVETKAWAAIVQLERVGGEGFEEIWSYGKQDVRVDLLHEGKRRRIG